MVENQCMDVIEEIIVEAIGLDMDEINFYQERKLSDKAINDFVEIERERNCLVKIGNLYYKLASIS